MKNLTRRSLSLLLALAMCLSLLTGITLTASAATVEYRYGSTSKYSNRENVIYNWGSRGTVATFLSPNAESFYEDNNTSYSALAALSGSSTESAVPSSALFQELRTLMTENHTYINSYDATRDMFAFTDCQNSALTSTKISSFYSGAQIGPDWDSGSTWNREHTWPNSKGDANGNGENDIMMLRPASSSENSGRNNTAYGESSGYYNPNKASGNTYDLRGDVARIVLYVYVRWQDTSNSKAVLFGTDGVIESKDVLLKWMEADPVDTWELGRNDSVESITGTRNVFVDYPELAFLLFDESVPADYQSPSNSSGSGGSTETVTVSFMENGKQTLSYTIPAGQSVEMPAGSVTPDEGYSFAGWVTDSLEETATRPANVYATGSNYSAAEQTFYALYTRVDSGSGTGNIYRLYTGDITEGDYVITYTDSTGTGAMEATISSNRFTYQNVTVNDDIISDPDSAIVWHIAADGSYYTIYNEAGYAAAHYTSGQTILLGWLTDHGRWTVSGTETYNFVNLANSRYLRKNSTYGFSCYASSTGGPLTLYKAATGTSYYTTTTSACDHTSTTLVDYVAATCTTDGYSGNTICDACGITIRTGTTVFATGHSYADGTCVNCGVAQPGSVAGSYTLITADTATAGNYIIGAVRDGAYPTVYPGTSAISGDWTVSSTAVTVENDTILANQLPTDAQVLILTGDNENGFTVGFEVNGVMKYLGYTSTTASRKLALDAAYSTTLWKIVADPDGGLALASSYGAKNYTISQNSTGTAPIRGYYTGTIYTGIYLFREVEPQAEPVASVDGVEYTTFEEAYAACGEGQYIKLLDNLYLGTLQMTKDLYIDLNGKIIEAVVQAGSFKVYGIDTATDGYTVSGGCLGFLDAENNLISAEIHVEANEKKYMAIEGEDGWTFNRYYMGMTHVSLDTVNTGLGFKAQLCGSEPVIGQVSSIGLTLSLEGGLEKTFSKDTISKSGIITARVKNYDIANYGTAALSAQFSVTLADGTVLTGALHSTSMKSAIEALNTNAAELTELELDAVCAFVKTHYDTMRTWQVDNLYQPE